MNNTDAYEELLAEGIRSEMLRAVLEAANSSAESDAGSDDADMAPPDAPPPQGEDGAPLIDASTTTTAAAAQLSTASDNATFLASRLTFTHDSRGQPIALDAEGNGVMMGWESGIMHQTARRMCEPAWGDRRERSSDELQKDEEGDREPLRVMNVGFGLGIVRPLLSRCLCACRRRGLTLAPTPLRRSPSSPHPSSVPLCLTLEQVDTYLQEYRPTQHLIIEPHPDVLAFAREHGWFDKPGVRFYEGTWKDYLKALESGDEEYVGWDGIYFGASCSRSRRSERRSPSR